MESLNIIRLFWIANIILWAFLVGVILLMANSSVLRRKGYNEEYIAFLRRDYITRSAIMAIVIPALEIAAYFVTGIFIPDVAANIEIVFLVFICMIIPFPIIDNISTSKKLKALSRKPGVELVVDLKHKVLNLIYNPVLELTLSIIVIFYTLFITKPVIIFYLHIILPWIFYATARKSRNTIRPHLKDGYLWAFVFIIINFGLVLWYLTGDLVKMHNELTGFGITAGILLVIILSGRIIYYLVNYPVFRQKLGRDSE